MTEERIQCPAREAVNSYCSCPKKDCPRHGLCCQCIVAHKSRTEEPILKRFPHCLRGLAEAALLA